MISFVLDKLLAAEKLSYKEGMFLTLSEVTILFSKMIVLYSSGKIGESWFLHNVTNTQLDGSCYLIMGLIAFP